MSHALKKGAGYASKLLEKVSRKLKEYAENPKLFFMHIPKTGGTSVKNAFRKIGGMSMKGRIDAKETNGMMEAAAGENLSSDIYLREVFKLRQSIAVRHMRKGRPVVMGHVPVTKNMIESFPEYDFFTVVRDPVDRWISEYRFGYEIGSLDSFIGHEPPEHPVEGVEMALNSEEGGKYSRNIYTCYLSGFGWQPDFRGRKARKIAKSNIRNFKTVFETENLKNIEKYIREEKKVKFKLEEKKNVTDEKEEKSIELKNYLNRSEVRDKIKKKLKKDTEIYRRAKQNSYS